MTAAEYEKPSERHLTDSHTIQPTLSLYAIGITHIAHVSATVQSLISSA